MRTYQKAALWLLASPFLALAWLFASGAVYYSNLPWPWSRAALAWTFGLGGPLAIAFLRPRRRTLLAMAAVWLVAMAWHVSIQPSNDRDWDVPVAKAPDAVINGDELAVTNIRNFDYRTPDDLDVRYYDKNFDLAKLQATDLVVSYWAGDDIAHTMLSFDFGGEDVLCLSVEVRREKDEPWGGIPGMFKQFEIIYVLADERDTVRLRTNYRKEDVYLFRTALSPEESRRLLTHVAAKVHDLMLHPEFYRTLANNCTTALVSHVNEVWPHRIPYSKKILMNGYAPEISYENGTLASKQTYEEYKRSSSINVAAQATDSDAGFSQRIRAHVR